MVADGHKTDAHHQRSHIYSSVVSRDSVIIALTIAALNDLDIIACDIQNAFLTVRNYIQWRYPNLDLIKEDNDRRQGFTWVGS
jgi:hypothetical protein